MFKVTNKDTIMTSFDFEHFQYRNIVLFRSAFKALSNIFFTNKVKLEKLLTILAKTQS